jgi:type IV secretory pathway VirB2 component (pilin)
VPQLIPVGVLVTAVVPRTGQLTGVRTTLTDIVQVLLGTQVSDTAVSAFVA